MKKVFKLVAAAAMVTAPFMGMNAQCPGALIVNEVSKGTNTNGTGQFIELIAAGAGTVQCEDDIVDVSGWIIDDNNGIFSNTGAQGGVALSGGHLRLDPTASLWKTFSKGGLIVLFNSGGSYDASQNPLFALAEADANGVASDGTAWFVAIGKSTLVQRNTSTPIASAPTSSLYCGRGTYTQAVDLSPAGIPIACTGDGIQVRCPGCQTGLGEPAFYHGVSYGTNMFHVSNPPATFFEGAHVTVSDTVACAGGKTFLLNTPTTLASVGADASWIMDTASIATPGRGNSTLDTALIFNIATNPAFTAARCAAPEIPVGAGAAALMITEISNGTVGSCEFIEILVANANGGTDANVDIRGWIIDDNSGNFNSTGCATGVGIGSGHYRLPFETLWSSVPVGSFLLVYNVGTSPSFSDNCYNLPLAYKDSVWADGHHVYYLPVAASGTLTGTAHLEMVTNMPSTSNCAYCTSIIGSYTTAGSWTNVMGFGNSLDAAQVRCPGCNSTNASQPSFYHGFGYGASPMTSIPVSAGVNLGGPVMNTTGGGSAFTFTGSTVASIGAVTGWSKVTATAATIGTLPASSATFYSSIVAHSFSLPACAASGARMAEGSAIAQAADEVRVYPNPAQETLTIEFPASTEEVSVKLMDINGRIVMDRTVSNDNKVSFNVSQLTPGLYLYQVSSSSFAKSGKIAVSK